MAHVLPTTAPAKADGPGGGSGTGLGHRPVAVVDAGLGQQLRAVPDLRLELHPRHDRPVADGAGRLWRDGESGPDDGGGACRLRGGDPRHQRRAADQPGLAVVAAYPARDFDRDPVWDAGRHPRGPHRGHLHDHDHAGDRGGVLLLHPPELYDLQRLYRFQQRHPTRPVRRRLAPGGAVLLSDARLRDAVLSGGRVDGAHAVRAGVARRARQPAAHERARLFSHRPSHRWPTPSRASLRRSAASCSSGRMPRSCPERLASRR